MLQYVYYRVNVFCLLCRKRERYSECMASGGQKPGFRVHFKKATGEFFLKKNFEVEAFCSSRFNDSNQNVISRIQIALAKALNQHFVIPEFIIVVLDDELIQYLKFKDAGASLMYGSWLEWLCK